MLSDVYRNITDQGLISPNLELGLVLHLDAGNLQSYPGSGRTWFDLSTSKNNLYWTNNSEPTFAMHFGHRVLRTTPLANAETGLQQNFQKLKSWKQFIFSCCSL